MGVCLMAKDENVRNRKRRLHHVKTKRQEVTLPSEIIEKAKQAELEKSDLAFTADQLAVLFICQRGHQSLSSIQRGVNSTRIPVGKNHLNEEAILSIITELEDQGLLVKAEIRDQPTWMSTPKAQELEL